MRWMAARWVRRAKRAKGCSPPPRALSFGLDLAAAAGGSIHRVTSTAPGPRRRTAARGFWTRPRGRGRPSWPARSDPKACRTSPRRCRWFGTRDCRGTRPWRKPSSSRFGSWPRLATTREVGLNALNARLRWIRYGRADPSRIVCGSAHGSRAVQLIGRSGLRFEKTRGSARCARHPAQSKGSSSVEGWQSWERYAPATGWERARTAGPVWGPGSTSTAGASAGTPGSSQVRWMAACSTAFVVTAAGQARSAHEAALLPPHLALSRDLDLAAVARLPQLSAKTAITD